MHTSHATRDLDLNENCVKETASCQDLFKPNLSLVKCRSARQSAVQTLQMYRAPAWDCADAVLGHAGKAHTRWLLLRLIVGLQVISVGQ